MDSFLYKDEGYKILGACFEVYKQMGCGFLESVYQECLEIEFGLQQIPFLSQTTLPLSYKQHALKQKYIPDFICFETIIVEIKAVSEIIDNHRAQVINYLKATGFQVAYLINFSHYPHVQHERLILGGNLINTSVFLCVLCLLWFNLLA